MSRTIINAIGEWLIDQALSSPDIVELFTEVCNRLNAAGVPVTRARLTWPTLHPLFRAETVLWKFGQETVFEQFRHQEEESDDWQKSPMHFLLTNKIETLRRNLDGENKLIDFPILEDLLEQGYTDYFLNSTTFDNYEITDSAKNRGIIVTWSSSREGGFSDDDLAALLKIQRRFAAACKTAVQARIARNVTETYLGTHAGSQVLNGAIKLGDGEEIRAVVWYSDMRRSTALADTMQPRAFLELLNDYFEVTAGPAIECGGEVLDFIGDAVLAIFPFENEEEKSQAISCATIAMERSLKLLGEVNERRNLSGLSSFDLGIGLNVGRLMFGNIGVASRLTFSVIGPTINEVERIETLTKMVEAKALVSREIARHNPEKWQSIGLHQLAGVSAKCELFELRSVPEGLAIEKSVTDEEQSQLSH